MKRRYLLVVLLVLAALIPAPARAQLGEQPIRIVFPFAAGCWARSCARLSTSR
jgi:hypothetical protein